MACTRNSQTHKTIGIAVCSFRKGDIAHAIDLNICDRVVIEQQCKGWYKGYLLDNRSVSGIFPSAYVHIKRSSNRPSSSTKRTSVLEQESEDQLVQELTDTLKEWNKALKKLYTQSTMDMVMVLAGIQKETDKLMELRASFTSPYLTSSLRAQLRTDITNKMDWGNKKLGLDVVPRLNGIQVGPASMSAVQLYQIHMDAIRFTNNSTNTLSTKKHGNKVFNSHHLYLQFKCLSQAAGAPFNEGDLAIYFSIYNYSTGSPEYISERVMCRLNRDGTMHGIEPGQQFTAMFVDLTTSDLNLEDAYLTAHIYKLGGLKNARNENSVITYKRPHACAALSLRDVLHSQHHQLANQEEESTTDFSMPLAICKDGEFGTITESLVKRIRERKLDDKELGSVNVALSMFHGEIATVRQEYPQLFGKNMLITQKLGFADVIAPGEVRNDFYVNLYEAEFEKGNKRAERNIEAKVLVVDSNGKELECISGDASSRRVSHYESAVFYHSNKPRWNEVIKVVLPECTFHNCHLRIEFRHCSNNAAEKKLFGFAYLPLEDREETTIQDRLHKLYVYKLKTGTTTAATLRDGKPHYLELAFEADNSGSPSTTSNLYCSQTKEFISVRTTLCSTKLTQDVNLVNFFKWHDKKGELDRVLRNVQKVKGDELMRHHTDFLNSLFQMTCDVDASQHQSLIFQSLIHILKFTKEKNYQQFLPVIELYIERIFCAPLVHRDLLHQMQLELEKQDSHPSQLLTDVIAVFDLLFKFIVRSAHLLAEKNEDSQHDLLSRGMENFWKALQKLVRSSNRDIGKMHLISRVVDVFPDLLKLLPPEKLAASFSETIRAIPKRDSDFGEHKLKCLSKLINSPLFYHASARHIVLEVCNSQLLHGMQHLQDLKLVAKNLADLLAAIHKHKDTMKTEVELVVLKQIRVLTTTIREMDESGDVGLLTACLITMLSMMDEALMIKVLQQENRVREFCSDIIKILTDTISRSRISNDWIVLLMLYNFVILSTAKHVAHALVDNFLSNPNFNELVWQEYLMLCVQFITQGCLQLETFSESKRSTLTSWYPDMRVDMANLLFDMWQELGSCGDCQQVFIPSMVGPFLQVAMLPENQLRTITIPVFYDMLMTDFDKVNGEIVDRLDEYFIAGHGDPSFKSAFSQRLMDAANTDSSGEKQKILSYVDCVSTLIDHLLDYRSEMMSDGAEQSEAMDEPSQTLMLATLNLLYFYEKEIKRSKLYIQYVYRLRDLNLNQGHYTEAGFTLLLSASLLNWTDAHLVKDASCQAQREWERKEQQYTKIISYFDKGQSWENAMPLCKELANFYETQLYDFVKLQNILSLQASLFGKIIPGDSSSHRVACNYYRIAFFGNSLPHCVRNKSFVYKASGFTGLGTVINEVKMSFPNASQLQESIKSPNTSQLHPNKQYFQAVKVEPDAETAHLFNGALGLIDFKISNFYQWNAVRRFTYDQPFHSPSQDKENEHRTLHKLRYVMTAVRPMPAVLHWCEIEGMSQETLCPLEVALESLTKKNLSLKGIFMRYKNNHGTDQNDLSMSLSGTVDAKVNGGLSMYQKAFFCPEYIAENPEHKDLVDKFTQCIQQHLVIIADGMNLFREIAKSDLRPLMLQLSEEFTKLRAKVKEIDPSCEVASLRSTASECITSPAGTDSPRISSGYSSSDVEKPGSEEANYRKSVSVSIVNPNTTHDGQGAKNSPTTVQRTRQGSFIKRVRTFRSTLKRHHSDEHITRGRSSSTFYAELHVVNIKSTSPIREDRRSSRGRNRTDSSSDEEFDGTLKREDSFSERPALPVKKRSTSISTQGSLLSPSSPGVDIINRPLPAIPGNSQQAQPVKRSPTIHGNKLSDSIYKLPLSPAPSRHRPLPRAPSTEAHSPPHFPLSPVPTPRKVVPAVPRRNTINSTGSDDDPPPIPDRPPSRKPKPALPNKSSKPRVGGM